MVLSSKPWALAREAFGTESKGGEKKSSGSAADSPEKEDRSGSGMQADATSAAGSGAAVRAESFFSLIKPEASDLRTYALASHAGDLLPKRGVCCGRVVQWMSGRTPGSLRTQR